MIQNDFRITQTGPHRFEKAEPFITQTGPHRFEEAEPLITPQSIRVLAAIN